jgi:hypothetical protein
LRKKARTLEDLKEQMRRCAAAMAKAAEALDGYGGAAWAARQNGEDGEEIREWWAEDDDETF